MSLSIPPQVDIALFATSAAAAIGFISAIWQHVAIAALEQTLNYIGGGLVTSTPGATALAFSWSAASLGLLIFTGVVTTKVSAKSLLKFSR
jgi:hypothetical protein